MSSLTTFVNCPTLQDRLDAVFCQSGGAEPLPLIGFLFSNENNVINLEQQMIQGTNIKTLQLTYSRRVLESEVDNYINYDTCTAPAKRGETSTTYTFDETKGLEIARKFDLDEKDNVVVTDKDGNLVPVKDKAGVFADPTTIFTTVADANGLLKKNNLENVKKPVTFERQTETAKDSKKVSTAYELRRKQLGI